ncbi:MAG: hypothetical protein H0X26_06665 [Alphaproteobacteria bacterium]|nr:hypothetical protein [Alphaproteobacteria bacterium]
MPGLEKSNIRIKNKHKNKNTYKITTNANQKYASFIKAFLVSSSLVTSAQGMTDDHYRNHNWSVLLTQVDRGSLGTKTLNFLDDRSLAKSAQVSQDWRSLVNNVHDRRYAQTLEEKASLTPWILEAVEAEPNEATRAWVTLKKLLENPLFQNQASADLKRKLLELEPRLLQPEALIWKDALNTFLSCSRPDSSHPALASLVQIIEDLRELEQDVQFKELKQENASVFFSLKAHYEQYLEKLLHPDADRAALTHPKVILSGEGLMNLGSNNLHSYRISQEMALSLLSKDKYGLFLKENASGSHAVKRQGRLHFKGNTTSTGLPVGMESAAYWLMQTLFGEGLAPTALLTLNEVEMRTPQEGTQARSAYGLAQATNISSNEFFKNYPQHQRAFTVENPHHVLQASLNVEGISLEDFMKGCERGEYNYQDLDLNSFSQHIFMSLLTNPSDGTPGNFMVRTDLGPSRGKPYSIVGIDNDMAFDPPIILTKAGKNIFKPSLEVKNVLYCLPLMKEPLASETRYRILQSSPELILLRWLSRLQNQAALYYALKETTYVKDNQTIPYLQTHTYAKELHLPLLLPSGLIHTLLEDFTKVQNKIRSRRALTHDQLFSFLQPLAHRFYDALKTQYDTPLSSYQFIHNSHHENIYLEDILEPYAQEILTSGQTIGQALAHIQTNKSDKAQSLEACAHEIWKTLDLNVQSRLLPFLDLAASVSPSCFQDKATVHSSWLKNHLLCRALIEGASEQAIKFLLSLGLDVGVRDSITQQNTLHIAIAKKYPNTILHLLLKSLSPEEQANILNGADHQGLTLLDEAMNQDEVSSFCTLTTLGASQCSASIALKFYKRKVLSNPILHPAFRNLMELNPEVEWVITLEELLPPLISKKDYQGMTLTSSTYGERQLPDAIKDQIVNAQGEIVLISNIGNHSVAYAQKKSPLKIHGLYFKAYPALPGLEEAAGSFTRQLLGFGAPYTDLVKLGTFPFLISQEIPGETLLKTLKNNPKILEDLDEEDLSGMLIAAMLTNPEDGKPDNYIVTPHPTKPNKYRIVGIDNDQAFVPAIVKETPDKTFLTNKIIPIAQVKTILYCLDQMKNPIHHSVRSRIINTFPDRFLEIWLRALKRVNNQHCGLFTSPEQNTAFQQHKSFIGVPFQQGAIRHIYEKLVQLRDLLTLHPDITHIDLLAKLEPRLAKRYQAALYKSLSVEDRFKACDRLFYEVTTDHTRGESHTTVTQSGDILQSMGLPLQEKLFDSIRLGKESCPVQALIELEQIRLEKNEETLKSLAARVGDINLFKTLTLEESRVLFLKELDKQRKALTPQEQTAILDYLAQQKGIRELPLSNFDAMDDSLFQQVSFEHLKNVDLRKCSNITYRSLVHLSKKAANLDELNLSFNPQLKEIADIGAFTDAPLIFKELRFLNLSNCIKLVKLLVAIPKLHYLNVENCALLSDQMLDKVIEGSEKEISPKVVYRKM